MLKTRWLLSVAGLLVLALFWWATSRTPVLQVFIMKPGTRGWSQLETLNRPRVPWTRIHPVAVLSHFSKDEVESTRKTFGLKCQIIADTDGQLLRILRPDLIPEIVMWDTGLDRQVNLVSAPEPNVRAFVTALKAKL